VRIAKGVTVGATRVSVEQLECAADHVTLSLRTAPPAVVEIALAADGQPVPVVAVQRDEETGVAKVTAYPIAKTAHAARIDVTAGQASGSVDVSLP
jgi:hypothetical protein